MNILEKILGEIKARKEEWSKSVPTEYEKNVCQGIEIAEEIVEEHLKCSGWIPVENELPEYGVDVLCMEKDTQKIYIGWCDDIRTFGISWLDNNDYFMDVEAWMPIPEPYEPKEPAKQSALSEREKFFTEGAPIYERTQTE